MDSRLLPLEDKEDYFLSECDFIEVLPNEMSASSALSAIPISIQIDVSKVVTAISNAYAQTAIAREEQKTERERIRQYAAFLIAQRQEETKRYEIYCKGKYEERSVIINKVCELISNTEINSSTIELLKILLDYLLKDSSFLTYQSFLDTHNYIEKEE